jgi:FolB domain-containing protein
MHLNPPDLRAPDGRLLDRIQINGLVTDCVVGIYKVERVKRQPLICDLALYMDTRPAARSAHLRSTVDYSVVAREIRFVLEECHFWLIETAAEALANILLAPGSNGESLVQAVSLRLVKPQALSGKAVPSINICRWASDAAWRIQEMTFGQRVTLHKSVDCVVTRHDVLPGQSVQVPDSGHSHAEIMCEGGLRLGDAVLDAGARTSPESAGTRRLFTNTSVNRASFLTVERTLTTLEDVLARDAGASARPH